MAGLNDVEKLERFYLNSCTDLPSIARSKHQIFPAVPRAAESEGEDSLALSRRLNSNHNFRRRSRSRNTDTNSKAKHAFFKVCGSLMSFGGKKGALANEEVDDNNNVCSISNERDLNENVASRLHLPPMVSMSKDEFIERFHCLVSEIKEKVELSPLPPRPPSASKTKVTASPSTTKKVSYQQNKEVVERERKGILTNKASRTGVKVKTSTSSAVIRSSNASPPLGKVIIIGLFVAVLLGIVKATTSNTTAASSSSSILGPRSFS